MSALEELDPLYHFNTHYPDRPTSLSDQYNTAYSVKPSLDNKKAARTRSTRCRKNNPRYKTQPITFDEIKEVEEPVTPCNDNNNSTTNVNSFLAKLAVESKALMSAENRLQPHHRTDTLSATDDMISVGHVGNTWYDSPYPEKLSFLDVPETISPFQHHHQHIRIQSEKEKLKGRAARRRNNPRYKTQPITFDEIKEVEEPESNCEQEKAVAATTALTGQQRIG